MNSLTENSTSTVDESLAIGIQPPAYRLPASARVGKATLAISQMERSVKFYRDVVGLDVLDQSGPTTHLGLQDSKAVLLELQAPAGVMPLGRQKRLGLYHTAFLLPSREALSSFVQHLDAKHIPFGAGDHLYSEAIYLTDPDGLGVEVYADRPRSLWTTDGNELLSGVEPLRLDELRKFSAAPWQGMPVGTTLGHLHFYVGDLEQASNFYHLGLGLAIMTWRYPGALFTSAGGYHHHVGLNVWAADSPQAKSTDARLITWELLFPDPAAAAAAAASLSAAGFHAASGDAAAILFSDPWGITVALTASR